MTELEQKIQFKYCELRRKREESIASIKHRFEPVTGFGAGKYNAKLVNRLVYQLEKQLEINELIEFQLYKLRVGDNETPAVNMSEYIERHYFDDLQKYSENQRLSINDLERHLQDANVSRDNLTKKMTSMSKELHKLRKQLKQPDVL